MELIKTANSDINYLSKVVEIKEFQKHPNADALKIAHVGGYDVIVGINDPEGLYIFFPTNSQINSNILSFANLYRNKEKNNDSEKSGFFNDNGRVTAIRLRGVPSEGFLMPLSVFENFLMSTTNVSCDFKDSVGTEFNAVLDGNRELLISRKYIVVKNVNIHSKDKVQAKKPKRFDKIIDTQFRLHYETARVQNNIFCVNSDDVIQVTTKYHGTSLVSANVLCLQPVSLFSRIRNLIAGYGRKYYDIDYDYVHSSRKVIKNQYYEKNESKEYCGTDIWSLANEIIKPHLTKGLTVYSEIIGFLPTGGYIQKGYDYGCVPPIEGEKFLYEKHYKIRVYRITYTNVDGIVHEFSAREVQQWCKNNDLVPVKELYYGKAKYLYPELNNSESWHDDFWRKMAQDKNFYMEELSPDCANKVPHEGICIRIEDSKPHCFKLKCFNFLSKIDMSDEVNIEDNA